MKPFFSREAFRDFGPWSLSPGGDTPALNATISGVVARANQLRIEVIGIVKGFNGLLNPQVPHVHLNPLYMSIPELDPTMGGTILGASRDYVSAHDEQAIRLVVDRLGRLKVELKLVEAS